MYLFILLIIAILAGYWLARSKFHEPIDKAAQQPKNWWNRLFNQAKTGGTAAKTSD